MGKFGRLAGVLATSAALAGGVEAQEAPETAEDVSRNATIQLVGGTTERVTNCVGFAKEQRALASEVGVTMSRTEQKSLLHECNNGQLEARIAEQHRVLAALDEKIHQIGLRVDEQARIIDAQGRELARIIAINNRLVIQREAVQAEGQQHLDEIERILNDLVG